MKNLFKYTMLVAAAVMAFACSKSDEPAYEVQDQAVKVAIAATSSIEVEGESRATLTPNEEDTYFTAAWETGDQLAIRTEYSTDGTAFTGKESQGQLSYTGNGIFEGTLKTQEGAVAWNYYAYYPWTSSNSTIPFGDRVQNGNNYNSDYDLMLGQCLGVQSELPGEGVALDMKRATALVYFHLTNTADWAQTEKVTRLVLSSDKWCAGTAKYSTSSYVFSIESANRVNDIVMTFEEGTNPTAAELKAYFNIFPNQKPKLTLTIYTEAHKLVIANPTSKAYEAGMLYKVAKDVTASAWADHNPGPLAAPVINTTPAVDHQSATFSWAAVANATGYAYTIDGGVEQTTTSTSVTISELTPETAYSKTLAVRALGDGAEYQDSEPASYTFAFTTEAAPAAGETTEYTLTLGMVAGWAPAANITGLAKSFGEHTWTAVDDSGVNTFTFNGTAYYRTDVETVWYFNKKNVGTYVQANGFGKLKSMTITLLSSRLPAGLVCKNKEGAVIEPTSAAKSATITYEFGTATDGFVLEGMNTDSANTDLYQDYKMKSVVFTFEK